MNMKKSVKLLNSNKLQFVLLPSFLALAPHPALAMDAATGTDAHFPIDRPGELVIQSKSFTTILRKEFFLHAEHHCTVVGSADLRRRTASKPNRYEIALSFGRGAPDFSVRRMVELNNDKFVGVSTTAFFTLPAGTNQVFLQVQRAAGPTFVSNVGGTAWVDDASMTINCFDSQLSNDVIL